LTLSRRAVLVTVGSTLFADLTNAVFEPAFIHALIVSGFTRLVVQYGSATLPSHAQNLDIPGISVEVKPYISDIDNAISQSDLIISHAGAGSIMSGLRKGKEMVVVPNTKLMDNHQVELAEVLQREGYLLMSTVE
jgi:beta-1,4-N-acetylglucosaminyltransferase